METETPKIIHLVDRALISVSGPDRRELLQGIVTNDIAKVGPHQAIWAALLSPQGKYLHDFFVVEMGEALLLDCEAARREDLFKRLKRFRLRSKVQIEEVDALVVAAFCGDNLAQNLGLPSSTGSARIYAQGIVFSDPRLEAMGARWIGPESALADIEESSEFSAGTVSDYEQVRLSLGVPDGSNDLEIDRSVLLEFGFDELQGVDWEKGCYMGQEVTARMHYRGLVKKRLFPVRFEGTSPAKDDPVLMDGKEVGSMRSVGEEWALAVLRIDAVKKASEGAQLIAGSATLTPTRPNWMKIVGD